MTCKGRTSCFSGMLGTPRTLLCSCSLADVVDERVVDDDDDDDGISFTILVSPVGTATSPSSDERWQSVVRRRVRKQV